MKNQHVETEYTEDGVRYKVRHDKGLLFATGTQWEGDAVCHLTYSDMSEMPVMEGLKTCILNKEVPEQFSPPYYLLVRTGVAGNFHYFPVPLLLEKVWSGEADRWMRRRYREIQNLLGIS